MFCLKRLFILPIAACLSVTLLGLKPSGEPIVLETSPSMKTETRYVVYSLEQLHYLGQSIQKLDMRAFLESYMEDLDANKLFFVQSDLEEFCTRFEAALPSYLRQQGNLFPAFEIFKVYKERVLGRIEWILDRLKGDFQLDTIDTFLSDRKKSPWARDSVALEQLWEKRLKHEILNELLWDKEEAPDLSSDASLEESPSAHLVPAFLRELLPVYTHKARQSWNDLSCISTDSNYLLKQERQASPDRIHYPGPNAFDMKASWDNCPIRAPLALNRAKKAIKKRYKRFKENLESIDAGDVEEIFLTSLTHMYDPHSSFLSADSMEEFAIAIKNALVGIGVVLYQEDGYCTIKELLPGGPAESTQQIQPGDKIIAVSNEKGEMIDVIGMRQKHIVKYLRGKKASPVHILVQSALDETKVKRVTIIRDEIKLASRLAKASLYTVPAKDKTRLVGLIDLPGFYGGEVDMGEENSSAKDLQELLTKLKDLGVEGIVLDLRYNSGGLFPEAIDVAGLFIPSGPILQSKDSTGRISEYRDYNSRLAWDGPLVVLISKYTASSSEIVIGALKNYRRAILIGDPSSHGKGTVQGVFEMDKSLFNRLNRLRLGAVKVTMQKWYLPNGESTQAKGVPADIILPSINAHLPVAETDSPRYLEWDSIAPLELDVHKAEQSYTSINPETIEHLKRLSDNRQAELPEFQYLRETVQWFKTKQEQKWQSLNFAQRKIQQDKDDTFRSQLKAQMASLKDSAYESQAILLNVALEQKEKPQAIEAETKSKAENTDLDIHLRESLRVMADWLNLLDAK
jgi:carboxyl-terminal processing protease